MNNSKNTSINNRLPRLFKNLERLEICGEQVLPQIESIMDFGCGRYPEHVAQWAKNHNINVHQYDPYWTINRYHHNSDSKANLDGEIWALCFSNVLNVVEDWSEVILSGIDAVPLPEGPQLIIATVYEGDLSGETKRTSKGLQQNKPIEHYLGYCRTFFGDSYNWFIRNSMLIGENKR